ncbi:TetR/AcrR family transcriptional regulator [Deinococcus hopiensis]|uniref:Transcriptional regulator, TetR family n=1 Tax=Deinococcus hopiensis KR-140 TaxID=695939 RepID=A0A1W1VWG1_9DEIO|nr:TetR/AcrR family transcriptional regulator [Deinococcus hopiensis]SMB97224.1 transcriptional regulator, TetR family [Deinococcus hopiensis KR-140]
MTIQQRKERGRAERQQMIVSAARKLAETEGWDAVTVRKLAEHIEYSQPVLYSHFRSKDEIVGAVALEGFAELTLAIRNAIPAEATGRSAVSALAEAYMAFAERHPAVYDSMFGLSNGLPFADERTPAPMREGFMALLDTLREVAGTVAPGLFTEVAWAALHGLVTLTRAGRLPPEHTPERLRVLVDWMVGNG